MAKIKIAGDGSISEHFEEMMLVLDALDEVQEGWADSLLTDESEVSDFMMSKEELKVFFGRLGIKGKEKDTILKLCKKMRKLKETE